MSHNSPLSCKCCSFKLNSNIRHTENRTHPASSMTRHCMKGSCLVRFCWEGVTWDSGGAARREGEWRKRLIIEWVEMSACFRRCVWKLSFVVFSHFCLRLNPFGWLQNHRSHFMLLNQPHHCLLLHYTPRIYIPNVTTPGLWKIPCSDVHYSPHAINLAPPVLLLCYSPNFLPPGPSSRS